MHYNTLKLSPNCRKHVENHFTIERMVDDYEKVYRQILAANPNVIARSTTIVGDEALPAGRQESLSTTKNPATSSRGIKGIKVNHIFYRIFLRRSIVIALKKQRPRLAAGEVIL